MDAEIRAARDAPQERQRALFYGLARHLFDNEVRDGVDERDDPKDNEAWLAALAEWFGWPEYLRGSHQRRCGGCSRRLVARNVRPRGGSVERHSAHARCMRMRQVRALTTS